MAQRTCDETDCERKHLARGMCRLHWKRAHGKPTRYPITCHTCRTECTSSRKDGRFCSDACKGSAYEVENRKYSRELIGPVEPDRCALPNSHPARRATPIPRIWYSGDCAWCGSPFTDNQPAARHCSPRCAARSTRARRRERKGEFAIARRLRLQIYVRDGWTCQLCIEPVDADATDVWRPTLDHIVPQSLGGSHAPENLRLAHLWCNSVRGDGSHHNESVLRISPPA